jgi:hypothetical protein
MRQLKNKTPYNYISDQQRTVAIFSFINLLIDNLLTEEKIERDIAESCGLKEKV